MKKLFIVIPKFNGEKEIKKCLVSLQLIKVPKGWEIKIIVVDNSKTNLGFARGVNVGIREALKKGAEAVLLLNQDTKVEKDFLFSLLENPADIVGPVIKFRRGGKWVYDFGGRINWWLGRNKHIEKFSIFNFQFSIDYVSGCAMMIRRGVFEKIGLFDERYFLYFEDADFCLRAKKAGFKIAIEPKSVIVHYLKEGRKKPLWQRWEAVKSNLIFINRWICWWRRPLAWGFWLVRGIKILIG